MTTPPKPRLVGINHVAIEVGDVKQALDFYGQVFGFELRGRQVGTDGQLMMAFLDMGDQFLALIRGRRQAPDDGRHFGLVVDDSSQVRDLALSAGATLCAGQFLDFLDPWGNRIEIVEYRDLQFSKTDGVLRMMGLQLDKSDKAQAELRKKGIS